MQKKTFTLLKLLAVSFQATELFIALGMISTLVLFPYFTRVVEHHEGNLGIFVIDGTPGFSFTQGSSGFSWTSVEDQSPALHPGFKFDLLPTSGPLGRITFGRFRFWSHEEPQRLNLAKNKDALAAIDAKEAAFIFAGPIDALAILAPVKWPFTLSILCTGAVTIAILELLSRMFRKVEEGEIFTRMSIRYAQAIGFLFIALSLLKGLTAGWLKHAMATVIMQQVAAGTIHLDSSGKGDSFGLITGLVVLALAEVFRQGLNLKEETALTI